jgi:hypothetical protein
MDHPDVAVDIRSNIQDGKWPYAAISQYVLKTFGDIITQENLYKHVSRGHEENR